MGGFIIVLSFALLFSIPLIALAEMHEIEVNPIQRCGPQCVIETTGFDTLKEAQDFNAHAQGHIYQIKDSNLWFVDYHVTEVVANMKEE